ncbi:hypothetical protein [Lacisediminihabitans changchengi]|uniref:Uncharacterized protein n=1 Tax=Lacisediminihabitans changchengi TaxID=2787634 RepID=A0A934SLD2_9MICO|nr:hypothetical protein [Lacisediminihabitans changchengi]MBK4347471.1 hypothetical protein [Lacisediminihabitans changchengi]
MKMRALGIPVLGAALLIALSGCSAPQTETRCDPGALAATPNVVAPGETVTVTAAPVACAIEFTAGRRYTLDLGYVGDSGVLWSGDVRVAADGSFSTVVRIPRDVPPGQAYLRVADGYQPSCDDTGACVDDSVSIRVAAPAGQ